MNVEHHEHVLPVEVLSTAADLGALEWAELTSAASLYSSYPWVRWCEESPDRSAAHLVCRDPGGRALAILPAFFWTGGGPSPRSWYDPHRVFLAPRCPTTPRHPGWFPLLLIGSCAGYRSDILFHPIASPKARARAADALLATARQIAADAGASLAAMYVPSTATELIAATAPFCPKPVPTSAESVIPVEAGGLGALLASLGRTRRGTISREIREFARAGHRIEILALSEAWPIAGRLLGELQRKYGEQDSDDEMLNYLGSQATFLDEMSAVIVEYDGSTPVGFCLTYEHGSTLYACAAGFRPGAARFAYFNVVMYQCVELAAARGLRGVNLGTSAYPAKCARGAHLNELWSAVAPPDDLPADQLGALAQPAEDALDAHVASSGRCFPGIAG